MHVPQGEPLVHGRHDVDRLLDDVAIMGIVIPFAAVHVDHDHFVESGKALDDEPHLMVHDVVVRCADMEMGMAGVDFADDMGQ